MYSMYKIDVQILTQFTIVFISLLLLIIGSVYTNVTARVSGIFLLIVAFIIVVLDASTI